MCADVNLSFSAFWCRMAKKKELSAKQKRFCYEYAIDQNATKAYKRAGYKCKGKAAASAAGQIYRNIQIRNFINFLIAQRTERLQVTADMTVMQAWIHYHRCVEVGDNAAANKALELFGRSNSAFPNKLQVGGIPGKPVEVIEIVRSKPKALNLGDRITELNGNGDATS